jgi:ABC-2 type transport system permease protein
MHKLWLVAVYEYRRNVFRKGFVFMLLSVPFFIALSLGFGLFMEASDDSSQTVGYVDSDNVLDTALFDPGIKAGWANEYDSPMSFVAFQSEEAARTALEADEIQAYFLVPGDFIQERQIKVFYINEPDGKTWRQIYDFLRVNLLSGLPPQIISRSVFGVDFIVRSIDGRRELPAASGPTYGLMMPLFIAIAVLIMLLMSSGYTMSAITDEKENRTMEVLVTTISPMQLIGGKIMGIVATSLTLLIAWTGVVVLGIFIARQAGVAWFSNLSMDWGTVAAVVAIAIPAYILAIALMTALSSILPTTQEGQAISTIFFILHAVPMYVAALFLKDPHSSLAVVLSLLPFTSLMTVGMRNLFTIVPAWQVGVSVLVQVVCILGAIWIASRAFRLGMLRYGQRLDVRALLKRG